MKKIKFLVLAFAFVVSLGFATNASAATTVTYSGGTTLFDNNDTTSSLVIYKDSDHTSSGLVYQCSTATTACVGSASDIIRAFNYEFKVSGENSYDWLSSGNPAEDCTGNTYDQCVTEIDTDAISNGTLVFNFAQMESAFSNGFLATTSFSTADAVTKSGSWLGQLLGGGLGLVDALIGWIIALIIITVIVKLLYHGLKWLHIVH